MFLRASLRSSSPHRSQGGARTPSPQPQPARAPLGNQAMQRLLRSGEVQAKLTVNEPGDRYEQEADQVAESVMRSPDPGAPAPAITALPASDLQRKCEHCAAEEEEEKKEEVQREAAAPGPVAATPRVEAQVRSLEGGGSSLAPELRGFFEPRFGRDLSAVRIHTEGSAADSARQLQARAYTRGSHIVFAAGEYSPHSSAGRRLLAHELTHVAQQQGIGGALARAPIQRQCSTANRSACSEEDLLTAVCIGEAGIINDDDGKQGPMSAVKNRTKDKSFGGSSISGQSKSILDQEPAGRKGTDPALFNSSFNAPCRALAKKVIDGSGGDPTQGAVFWDQCCERPCEQVCTGYLGDGTNRAHFFARRATPAEVAVCRDSTKNPKSNCDVCGTRPAQAHCDKRCCQKGSVKGAVPDYPGTKTSAAEEAPEQPEAPREAASSPQAEPPANEAAAPATATQ